MLSKHRVAGLIVNALPKNHRLLIQSSQVESCHIMQVPQVKPNRAPHSPRQPTNRQNYKQNKPNRATPDPSEPLDRPLGLRSAPPRRAARTVWHERSGSRGAHGSGRPFGPGGRRSSGPAENKHLIEEEVSRCMPHDCSSVTLKNQFLIHT